MTALLATMAPIFGLMLVGFAAVKVRAMDRAGVQGLVLFVFNFSIPALLFRSLGQMAFPTDLEWGFLVAFYAGSLVTYALAMGIGRAAFDRSLPEQAIFGMGAAFSNLVLMGIPIILMALGPEASLPMFLIIGFHSATFMPLTVALIQGGRDNGASRAKQVVAVFLDVLRNPIILGILCGVVVNVVGISPWGWVDRILEFLADAAVPCALFALGASLAVYPLVGEVSPAVVLTVLKLAVHPFLVWLIAVPIMGLDGLWITVAIVMAAMPSGVNVYLFGARYGAAPGVAARTVLLTTLCSMGTIAAWLTLVAR